MSAVFYHIFDTALGFCGIAWGLPHPGEVEPRVVAFQLPDKTPARTAGRMKRLGVPAGEPLPEAIVALEDRVRKHFDGAPQDFRDVPVDLGSTPPFERQVYEAARGIRPGETRSYGQLAAELGDPGAARAVGRALGRNPVALIIPCHRVLAAGGQPGGFSAPGGRDTKARLLALEGVDLDRGQLRLF